MAMIDSRNARRSVEQRGRFVNPRARLTATRECTWIAVDPKKVAFEPFSTDQVTSELAVIRIEGNCFGPAIPEGFAITDTRRTIRFGDFVSIDSLDKARERQRGVIKQYLGYDIGHIYVRNASKVFRLPLYSVTSLARVSYMTRSVVLLNVVYQLFRLWPAAGDRRIARLASRVGEYIRSQATAPD